MIEENRRRKKNEKNKRNPPNQSSTSGGGSILSKGNNPEELERFTKNKKQKKIIVGGILGILLVIGSIVLYRSYALYEEEKEFNVLKGQIPDFGYDIKMLSVVIDGEKSTTIPARGLYKANVECSGGTTGEWDYNAWNVIINNAESNTRCNIEFTSNLTQEEYDKYIEAGKALRRNTYRGKDITEYHNDGSLYEMISSGRFDDIYVGDYIIANNITWLVADIDNYLYSGETKVLTQHHLTMTPSLTLGSNVIMNDTNTTEGGYYNSKMVQTILPNIFSTYIEPAFKNHIISYQNLLSNGINANAASMAGMGWTGSSNSFAWYERKLDLMSESNVYGTNIYSSSAIDTGIDSRQYALFSLKPELITAYNGRKMAYWLKNVASSSCFAIAHIYGQAYYYYAKDAVASVRPRFLIG